MDRSIVSLVGLSIALAGMPSMASAPARTPAQRAVVLVSGGATRTPFTTPTEACREGAGFLAAGSTYTALRQYLLGKGKLVYTAPAMDAWGVVQEAPNDPVGPFAQCPQRLPEHMTIVSTGDWNAGGERLVRFLEYLRKEYGIKEVDLVGHSNGGIWTRAAIKILKDTGLPIKVRSLITIGAPHTGAMPARFYAGEINLSICAGVATSTGKAFCEQSLQGWGALVEKMDKGLSALNTVRYTSGPTGWNAAQGSALSGIPVTLMGGTYFQSAGGEPTLLPYDGTVSSYSALAQGVPSAVIPWRACWQGPLVHWIGWADQLGIPRDRSITDNPEAMARVNQAIDEADIALKHPNGKGCL